MDDERRDDERDVMAYLKGWSPWEAAAPNADVPGPEASESDVSGPDVSDESRRIEGPPAPPSVASAPEVPFSDPPTSHRAPQGDSPDAAARYRRGGWQIAGAVFGLIFAVVVVVFARAPTSPVFPESAAVGTPPAAAPAPSAEPTMWLFAGEGWFYEDAGRTRMRNRENACTLATIDVSSSADAASTLSEAEITESVIGQYAVDPASVTPQDPAVIVGRDFAVTRVDGVALAGVDPASVVFVVVRAEPGGAPMAVTLACPPAALADSVPALDDALQNVWIRPRSVSTTE